MSRTVDPARFRDPVLRPIAAKVLAGTRLDPADGRALFETGDILSLGELAAFANHRKNGDRVFFSANQHLNPTNVCVLRNTCTFCSFARTPKEAGAYTRSLEEVYHEAEQARVLIERGVEGLVFIGDTHRPELYRLLETARIPYVNTYVFRANGAHPSIG